MERKRRDWGKLAVLLCVVLLGLNLWQLRQVSDLRGELARTETNLQMETRRLDERLVNVQRMVRDADKLVQDWEVVSVSPDVEAQCLRAEVSLRLKEWREDTQVQLTAAQEAETWTSVLAGGGGQYTGAAEIPANSREVRLAVQVSAEGLQKEEELGAWQNASMLLPVQCYGWGAGGPDYTRNADKSGTLTVSGCEAELSGFEGRAGLPQLSGQVFRLRRNGEVAAEKTAMYGETIGQYTCEELTSEAQIGDRILLTFFCRDESGLGYEFFLNGWEIDENGIKDSITPETDWPRLTWD